MLNNLILVGRVTQEPTPLSKTITIAAQRSYKNTDTGMYDTDFFDITASTNIMQNAIDYLKQGDMVGIRGHLETTKNNLLNKKEIKIICDKLTFLSQAHSVNNEEEN